MQLIYDKCMPYDPVEAVLQQEVIVYSYDYDYEVHPAWPTSK